jgi:hypothetical protein
MGSAVGPAGANDFNFFCRGSKDGIRQCAMDGPLIWLGSETAEVGSVIGYGELDTGQNK